MINPDIVKFTKHALLQMNVRGISENEVYVALGSPDEVRQGTHSNETIATKRINGKRVRVIYVSAPVEIRVITVTL